MRSHLALVESTARRVLGEDDAGDTVQTVFAILMRKAPRRTIFVVMCRRDRTVSGRAFRGEMDLL